MRLQGNLLYVRDLAASVRYYQDGLGLSVVARPAPHMAILGLENGVIFLHADPTEAPDWLNETLQNRVRGVGVLPHFEVDDITAVKERLEAHEYEISLGPVEEHGSLRLYVYDPSGYNIVFVQAQ